MHWHPLLRLKYWSAPGPSLLRPRHPMMPMKLQQSTMMMIIHAPMIDRWGSQPASQSQRATDGGRAGRRDPFSLRRCRCLCRASASRWVSSDHDELPGLGWVWVGPVHWAFLFRRPAAPARRPVFSLLCLLSGLVVLVSAICCQIIAILQKIESLVDEIHTKQKPLKLDENCQLLDECAHVWMEFLLSSMCLHHSRGCHQCNYLEKLKKIMEVWQIEVNGRPHSFEDVGLEMEICGPR